MAAFPQLSTERLILRELTANDAEAILAIHSDAVAMRWFGNDAMGDLAQAQKLIELFASWRELPNPGIRWGIEYDGEIIGSCGFFRSNLAWRSCMLGYELAQKAWGQGLMREALQAILPWAFTVMNMNRIEAQIHPENTSSLRLIRHLGFQHEGRLRQAAFWNQQFHDFEQFSLLQSDLNN